MNRRNFFGFLTGAALGAVAALRGVGQPTSTVTVKTGTINANQIATGAVTEAQLATGTRAINGLGFQPKAVVLYAGDHWQDGPAWLGPKSCESDVR